MLVDLLTQNRTIETTTPANPADWLTTLWAGSTTSNTGATVTPTTAMTYGAVFACVRILAESEASLPLITYERLNPGKRRASEHRNYRLLHDAPNPEMTRSEFWEAMIGLMVLWGNSYAEIERDNGFRIKALWPLRPDYMTVKRTNGQLVYEYTVNGTPHYLPPERVLHLRGLGGDGVMGYSPIYLAREAIGLGMATEEYGARFFANDARPGGILTYPGKLNKTQRDNVKDSWEDAHRGLTQSNRIAVLESGFTWQAIGMPNDDAEFLATRKFQITEVARWFRIPPHMLADLEKATFCLPADVEVLTESGPKSIAQVQVGERVWSWDGNGMALANVSRSGCTGSDEILTLRTTNRTLRANRAHRVLALRKVKDPQPGAGGYQHVTWQCVYVPAGELEVGDTVVTLDRLPDYGHDQAPTRQVSEGFMEFCGLLLGDGNVNRGHGVTIARAADATYMDHYRKVMREEFRSFGRHGNGRPKERNSSRITLR